MNKIRIIIPYFGSHPEYLPYFLKCASYNAQINWLFFSDKVHRTYLPANVDYFNMNINEFARLASEKLGFQIEINDPYKLCDFKPTYGLIFEDFLKGYDFWGYCDIDILLGDAINLLLEGKLMESDIISTYSSYLSGPFCLFHNNKTINNLFRQCPSYKAVFQDKEYKGFDENISRSDIAGINLWKVFHFVFFMLMSAAQFKFYSLSLRELKYQFQWYYKRITIQKDKLSDMTEVAFWNSKNQIHKVSFIPLMKSDLYFKRIGKRNWQIKWDKGKLWTEKRDKEIFGFHFRESKGKNDFKIDQFDPSLEKFALSEIGFKNAR